MDMKSIEDKLIGYFAENEDIAAVWLFGSVVSGTTHHESDVDLAFLFRRKSVPDRDHLLQIQDNLTSLLKKETDVVVLNQASPIIRMQVLRKGKKILEKDRRAAMDFFVRTVQEYDDLKMVRSVIEKKITRGRIYG